MDGKGLFAAGIGIVLIGFGIFWFFATGGYFCIVYFFAGFLGLGFSVHHAKQFCKWFGCMSLALGICWFIHPAQLLLEMWGVNEMLSIIHALLGILSIFAGYFFDSLMFIKPVS